MDIVFFCAFNLSFSTFIGGYFLWTACWLYDEWNRPKERARAKEPAALPRALKTTDAGPYTAPGVPTEPSEDYAEISPEASHETLPSYAVACVINFVVYWTVFVALIALGFWLYGVSQRANTDYLTPYFFLLAPALAFAIALFLHTVLLQTNPLRGFLITLMLLVPWGAVCIALTAICMLR